MDNVVRKKATIVVSIILVMTTLCGCSVVDNFNNFVNRKKEVETMSRQAMECIVNKNKTELINLFSTDIQDNHMQQISLEFENAFEFINGKIISYEYDGIHGESEAINYGKVERFDCESEFHDVITDTGFKYEIWFSIYHTWEEKPEREGIAKIQIVDAENYKNRVGIGLVYSSWD